MSVARTAAMTSNGSVLGCAVPEPASPRMPAIFLAHGSPLLLDDAGWVAELNRWAQAIPRPESVLMLSAHWEHKPVTLGATRTIPLVRDFYGFPAEYYQVTYPAPGAPALAARVRAYDGPNHSTYSNAGQRLARKNGLSCGHPGLQASGQTSGARPGAAQASIEPGTPLET